MSSGEQNVHIGFLGSAHEGRKEDCALCNLPDGKIVTIQELMDWHATKTMERAEAIAEAWGTYAVLRFPWHDRVAGDPRGTHGA